MKPHQDAGSDHVTRREFMGLVGAGVTVFFSIDEAAALSQEPERLPQRTGASSDPNAYLHIGADGRVTGYTGKVELGQGAMTALPQLLAEELDVSLDSVTMVMGDTETCPYDGGTYGSLTIRQFGPVLRAAAAEARGVLLQLAAERLQAPVERLQVKAGVVSDSANAASKVTYAQLTEGRRIERRLEKKPAVKAPDAFAVIGHPQPRRDARDKVTGRAVYAGDRIVPGLLHARLVRPPAHGAKLTSIDTAAAERIGGVRVVRDGDLVAVVHERRDVAEKALDAVKAQFERTAPPLDDSNIFDYLVKNAPPAQVVHDSKTLAEGEKLAATTYEYTYLNSYVAHATMETHSATVQIESGKVTVWASTQSPFGVRGQVSQALGLPAESVHVLMPPYVGGGFGGKTGGQQAVEAARLAKLTGRPVQVVWDRDEEFFYDTFRPAAVVKVRSGLSGAGRIVFWDFDVYAAGNREAKQFYDIDHQRTISRGGWQGGRDGYHPFGIGPWRAPSVNTNTFARESQIDIMASKIGVDPVEFRRRHLSDPRMLKVVDVLVEAFGWKPGKTPSGRGVGVACAMYLGTYVATMCEVAVDRPTGKVQVKRIACAQDMGIVVNPDGARQQTEGSLTMGLGYALSEEVRFKSGEVLDRNFDSYEVPRFSWLPEITTLFVNTPSAAMSGCGEPPIVCVGAVIANAIFDATGARLFQLPMTPARVKDALART